MSVGGNIKICRQLKDLTQRELADRLHVKQPMIGQWEKSDRSPKYQTLLRIAAALDVDVEYLTGDRRIDPVAIQHGLTPSEKRAILQAESLENSLRTSFFDIVKAYCLHRLAPEYRLAVEDLNNRTGRLGALEVESIRSSDPDIVKRIEADEYDALVTECLDIVESLIDRHILAGLKSTG